MAIDNQLTQTIANLIEAQNVNNNLLDANILIETLNIHPNYPIILIGGTNGKGSTCAYLTNILKLAGYKIGTFTSPHVFQYNERICINNDPISNNLLNSLLTTILNKSNNNFGLFKAFTIASHLYFMQENVDIAIIEVGIGGQHDITNLFEPTISAITCVDYDHCHILGNTLDEIGLEKAGIFRSHKAAFFGGLTIPQSVKEYAIKIEADLESLNNDFGVIRHDNCFDIWCGERNFYTLPYPSLRGAEQVYNVALSLAILTKLHYMFPVSLNAIKTALLQTKLIGRFQVMPGRPQIIFDVAHNPQAVQHMLENMVKLPFAKKNIAVFGIASDKDVTKIIELCKNSFTEWHIAKLNTARGLGVELIKKVLLAHNVKPEQIIEHNSIKNAMKVARRYSTDDDRIICFGSFLTVEEAYNNI